MQQEGNAGGSGGRGPRPFQPVLAAAAATAARAAEGTVNPGETPSAAAPEAETPLIAAARAYAATASVEHPLPQRGNESNDTIWIIKLSKAACFDGSRESPQRAAFLQA